MASLEKSKKSTIDNSRIPFALKKGKVRMSVREAVVVHKSKAVILVFLDTATKRPIYDGSMSGDFPIVYLDADKHSLNVDHDAMELTRVDFPSLVGWAVWSAHSTKNGVRITFMKEKKT